MFEHHHINLDLVHRVAILAQAHDESSCQDELCAPFRAIHHFGDSVDRGIDRGDLQRGTVSVPVLQDTNSR